MHENSNFTYQKFIDKYDKIDWAIQAKIIGADADYELPSSVTVKVGGTTKTEDTDYTWDATGGILHILPEVVSGDVEITVTATAE